MAGSAVSRDDTEVVLAAAGDREAFARLVDATRSLVSAIALAEVRDPEVARDVAQDVYLQVWRDLRALRNPGSFLPFLRQVTRQRARQVSGIRAREVRGGAADATLEAAVDPGEDASHQLLHAERLDIVRQALGALPDDARETVTLYYLEGHSAAQVARLLGIQENVVHQRLSRARVQLRADVLRRLGDALGDCAPAAAFTTAVVASLPGTAAAASVATAGFGAAASTLTTKVTVAGIVVAAIALFALLTGHSGGPGSIGPGGSGGASIARPHQPPTREPSSSPPAPAEAAPTSGLDVRVTAAGAPVPGAEVRLYRRVPVDPSTGRPAWQASRLSATGPDGVVRLPAEPGALLISARAAGFAAGQVEVVHPSGQRLTRVELELTAPSSLAGRVVAGSTGAPVPLANLSLERESSSLQAAADFPLAERFGAVADPHGRFAVGGLAPGRYRLVAEAPGHARTTLRQVRVPRQAPLGVSLGGAGVIEGQVWLPDGKPAVGAEVTFVGGPELLTVTTGPGGGFAAEVQPGNYFVSAILGLQAGSYPEPVAVTEGATRKGISIRLGAAGVLAGRVLTNGGAPVPGAQVSVSSSDGHGELARSLATSSGAFELGPLAPGEYDLRVVAPGFSAAARRGLVVLRGQRFQIDVRLDGVGAVEGVVRDEGGAPVAGARVAGGKMWGGALGTVVAEAVTGADGGYLLDGLDAGVADVRARRPGVAMAGSKTVQVVPGQRSTADFVLPATGKVEGVARFQGARPADPVVLVRFIPAQPMLRARDFERIEAAEDGRFGIELPVGAYRILAYTADRTATSDPTNVKVSAGESVPVELVLKTGADDPTRLRVSIREPGGAPAAGAVVVLEGETSSTMVSADESGQALLIRGREPVTLAAMKGGRSAGPVAVPSDAREMTLELLAGARLRGRVIGAGGSPVPGFTLRVEPTVARPGAQDPGTERHFTGDRFELGDFRSGPVRLVVVTSDGQAGEAIVALAPGESAEQDVTVRPAGVIRVRPTSADGRPIAGAYVVLGSRMVDSATDGVFYDASATRDGEVVVDRVPPGRHEIRIGARQRREVVRQVDVGPGQTLDLGQVVLDLPASAKP